MKIAVSAMGNNLEARVDPRFGRCHWLIIVNTDDMSFEAMESHAAMAGHGAGIKAAQMVAEAGCEGVVAANFGPNSAHALSRGGLKMYRFTDGTVQDAVEAVKAGAAQELSAANVGGHFGNNGSRE